VEKKFQRQIFGPAMIWFFKKEWAYRLNHNGGGVFQVEKQEVENKSTRAKVGTKLKMKRRSDRWWIKYRQRNKRV